MLRQMQQVLVVNETQLEFFNEIRSAMYVNL